MSTIHCGLRKRRELRKEVLEHRHLEVCEATPARKRGRRVGDFEAAGFGHRENLSQAQVNLHSKLLRRDEDVVDGVSLGENAQTHTLSQHPRLNVCRPLEQFRPGMLKCTIGALV